MKRIIHILACMFIASFSTAQTTDSIKIINLEKKIAVAESSLTANKRELNKARREIEGLRKELLRTNEEIVNIRNAADTAAIEAERKAAALDAKIDANDNKTVNKVSELDKRADNAEINIKERTLWGTISLSSIFAALIISFTILHFKGKSRIEKLKAAAEKLNEEIISRISTEVNDIQKIANSIGNLSAAGASADTEQQLIKTLADRVTFMEMTLYKMDKSVRGHRQLTKSIAQMKDNMLAYGYEIIDMLGKPYHEGMKVIANFIEDEELEAGQQIITGIIKPQINYRGEMIQAAQITVSQNI